MSEIQSGTTPRVSTLSLLRKPILIAGLLGGLLGGVASSAANRLIKPTPPTPQPTAKEKAAAEARNIVEALLAELDEEKDDQFISHLKLAWNYRTDKEFNDAKEGIKNSRFVLPRLFGPSLHEVELIQETTLSPNLIQFVYLERFTNGPVIWKFVMYRGKNNWRIAFLEWDDKTQKAFSP